MPTPRSVHGSWDERLNQNIKGHRVCDFPHAIYKAGSLGDFGLCPSTGVWILEIQIAHPTRPFGAFYEDLLISDEPTEQLFSYGTLQLQSMQVAAQPCCPNNGWAIPYLFFACAGAKGSPAAPYACTG